MTASRRSPINRVWHTRQASPGLRDLALPPSALDPDPQTGIPSTVIKLLNTSITSSTFVFLNP